MARSTRKPLPAPKLADNLEAELDALDRDKDDYNWKQVAGTVIVTDQAPAMTVPWAPPLPIPVSPGLTGSQADLLILDDVGAGSSEPTVEQVREYIADLKSKLVEGATVAFVVDIILARIDALLAGDKS